MVHKKFILLKGLSMAIDKAEKPKHVIDSAVVESFGTYLNAEWGRLAKPLFQKANNVKQTKKSTDSFIKAVDKQMAKFGGVVSDEIKKYVDYVYKFGKTHFIEANKIEAPVTVEKATANIPNPSFPVIWFEKDIEAVLAMETMMESAAGEFYATSCQSAIMVSVKSTMLEQNLSATEAITQLKRDLSRALRIRPGNLSAQIVKPGWRGTSDGYFKMLANHNATQARTIASVFTLADIEAKYILIRSRNTKRTCIGCAAMDGTRYKTADAVVHAERILNAENLDELKEIQPFFSYQKDGKNSDAKITAAENEKDNFQLPPFHGLCECYTQIG